MTTNDPLPAPDGPRPDPTDPSVVPGPTERPTGPVASHPGEPDSPAKSTKSLGYWPEVWRRFRKRKLSMAALVYVVLLTLVAIFSPAIAGTKPLLIKYKGHISSPALGYFYEPWEDTQRVRIEMRKRYTPEKLEELDPDGWAIWPLVFQDPLRRVRDNEWGDRPGNPSGSEGRPSDTNTLGTTQRGVDVFAQLVHGTRIALLVGFVSTGISAAIGITLGALAGYLGGWIDIIISRIIEVMMCIPVLVLILALWAVVDRATIWHLMVVIGVTGWTGIARLMRAEFLKLRTTEYVTAARAVGAGQTRIMFRHILPNALAPILVPITFGIASAILIESALSFLGFGAPPPNASWGSLLKSGLQSLDMWWLIFYPGAAIFMAVLTYNLIGEGLQEATDPRLREGAK